jgi:hypothetical protein
MLTQRTYVRPVLHVLFALMMVLAVMSGCAMEEEPPSAPGEFGTFEPYFEDEGREGFDLNVSQRRGWFEREGNTVWIALDVIWDSRNGDTHIDDILRLHLPFEPSQDFLQSVSGSVRLEHLDDGAPTFLIPGVENIFVESPVELNVAFEILSRSLVVVGSEDIGSETAVLTYGAGQQRVIASLVYVVP